MDSKREKIKRFTSGKFSFNDYLWVSSELKKQEPGGEFQELLEEDWNVTGPAVTDHNRLNRILDKLHFQIKRQRKAASRTRFYHLFSRTAAILIVPALITIAVLSYLSINGAIEGNKAWVEIYSPAGSRTKFHLPDGTEGWLNSGSSIKYPVDFSKRTVEVSGEAWFDVVRHKSGEFKVSTPWFDVKVLGTRFNVTAYDNERSAEVILEKGKVVVVGKDGKHSSELKPDQQFIYRKLTGEYAIVKTDAQSYTNWKDGLLTFRNEPMTEIARRLERKYNAEIILHGDSLKRSVFRATFTDESLDEICRMLSTVAPVKYKMHKRELQADGAFTKSKVEMWLR